MREATWLTPPPLLPILVATALVAIPARLLPSDPPVEDTIKFLFIFEFAAIPVELEETTSRE
jgi:hypothetical protein